MSEEVEPPVDGGADGETPASALAAEDGGIRVLHVDDDDAVRDVVARHLERRGMRVLSEPSPSAALDRLADVDCVVSDYEMPDADGLDLFERVRERRSGLPFVLFTAEADKAAEAIGAGVTDYVQKRGGRETYDVLANRVENAVARHRVERAHRRSRRRFDALFETVPDAVLDVDADGVVRAANPAVRHVLGREPDALVGTPVTDLLPPERRETYAERLAQYLETGERALPWTDTVVDVEVDGERRPVSVSLGDRTIDGERHIVAVVRDISERADHERRLREAERRYRRLVEANVVGIYTLRDGTFEYVNPRMADLLDYDPGELVGEPVASVVAESEHERLAETLETWEEREGESASCTIDLVRRDGDRVTVEVEGTPVDVESGDGDAPLVVGAVRDVTGRVAARRELQESHERITALHDAAVEVAGASSVDAVARRTVETADEVLEMDRSVVTVAEGDTLRVVAASDAVASDGYHGEVAVDAGDSLAAETFRTGESALVDDLRDAPYDAADDDYRSVLSVPMGERGVFQAVAGDPGALDETDLETAELLAAHAGAALDRLESRRRLRDQKRRLERQNERLETFASVVSHDLRNPIEVARANLELATHDDEGAMDRVDQALDRMDEIVADVLQLARGPDDVEETEPVVLETVAREAWANVHAEDATLSVESDEDDPFVLSAARGQLKRLLENLLGNAVEHGATDSRPAADDAGEHDAAGDQPAADASVTVRVGVREDESGFFVADDGPGFPAGDPDELLEPGASGGGGTGLGLAIVEGVAEAHGWSVAVGASEAGGARVDVTGVETI